MGLPWYANNTTRLFVCGIAAFKHRVYKAVDFRYVALTVILWKSIYVLFIKKQIVIYIYFFQPFTNWKECFPIFFFKCNFYIAKVLKGVSKVERYSLKLSPCFLWNLLHLSPTFEIIRIDHFSFFVRYLSNKVVQIRIL